MPLSANRYPLRRTMRSDAARAAEFAQQPQVQRVAQRVGRDVIDELLAADDIVRGGALAFGPDIAGLEQAEQRPRPVAVEHGWRAVALIGHADRGARRG